MTNKERAEAFLRELKILQDKYGICVGSCGCCQSPFLVCNEELRNSGFDKEVGDLADGFSSKKWNTCVVVE